MKKILYITGLMFILCIVSVNAYSLSDVLAYYKLNNNATDYFGTYNGTINGGSFVTNYSIFNISGNGATHSYNTETTNVYIDTNLGAGKTYNQLSVNFWFKSTSNGANFNDGNFFAVYAPANAGTFRVYGRGATNTGRLIVTVYGDSFETAGTYNDGNWKMATLTNDASGNWSFYINGALLKSDSSNGSISPTYDFMIGGRQTGAASFSEFVDNAYIDEVAIFNKSLTIDEIRQIYNYGLIATGFDLSVTITSPSNGTNVNSSRNITFEISNSNNSNSVNCKYNISYGNITALLENKNGLNDGSYSFSFNSTYWQQGYNNISIFCNDTVTGNLSSSNITLYVDTINPIISFLKYKDRLNITKDLNNSILSIQNVFNITSNFSDDNLYMFNLTVYNSTGKSMVSYQILNINDTSYSINRKINMTTWRAGTYNPILTVKDAHTLQLIDFSESLKEQPVTEKDYIGKVIDDDITIKSKLSEIKDFKLIERTDRKKFDITFNKDVTEFSMFVEAKHSIDYVGDKYGYQGHFILDNHYWYDLENKDGAKVKNVIKHNDLYYEIIMTKPAKVNNIIFNSIGIINTEIYNATYNYVYTNTSIELRYATTKALMTGINLTVQYVGTNYQTQKTTTTGKTSITTRFDELTDNVSLRAFETNKFDYSIVIKEIILTQGIDSTIILYLTNTSDIDRTKLVTFEVIDQEFNILQGARIEIQKQDPATNTFIHITDLTTNSQGKATTILVTDTVFYKWNIYYEGNLIYTLNLPVTVSLNDNTIKIRVVIPENYNQNIIRQIQTRVNSFNWIIPTNTTGYFNLSYNSIESSTHCLYVYEQINTSYVLNHTKCVNNTFGTITSNTLTNQNFTRYLARYTFNYNDGVGESTKAQLMGIIIGESSYTPIPKNESAIFMIIIILIVGLGFVMNPLIGLILLSGLTLVVNATKLAYPYMNTQIAMGIVAISLISMYVVYKKYE